jgi:ankyrin repeat protein
MSKKLNQQIVEALENDKLSDVKKLLKDGADPNYQFKTSDNKEYTLLHRAVFLEDLPYVKILVENGADVNRKSFVNGKNNKLGDLTPIQHSVLNGTQEPDNFKVLKYLLSANSNIYIRNSAGSHTRDLAKFREKKDKNKKYLKIIDDHFKGKKKLMEKLQKEAFDLNPKKKSATKKKKVSVKQQRKASLKKKDQKGGANLLEERLFQNLNLILNSM